MMHDVCSKLGEEPQARFPVWVAFSAFNIFWPTSRGAQKQGRPMFGKKSSEGGSL